ncbi:MAG: PAS domain S-box protein [Nitrosomonadales bacterium]|nr:PAS domain S-box protein [Nitrosomonadales bacterium]
MEHSYILSILYEMALVIGGEVSVKPLLNKTLQRLLYHTSFPAGFVCLQMPSGARGSAELTEIHLDAAVGDYELAGMVGKSVRLPQGLLCGPAERGVDTALLAALPVEAIRYQAFLRLPIEGQGVIVLLSPHLPDSDLPLTQLFQPVMANLAKAIILCRSHDVYTGGLIAARDTSLQALATSEEKFRAISTAVLDALIMVDDSSALVYWNPAAERILGYRPDEVIGKPLHQLLTPQRYMEKAIEGFRLFSADGHGPIIGKTIEVEALHKDGHEIPVELSISGLMLNGHWHAIGMMRDISARKRAEEALRHSMAGLNEAERIAQLGNWELDLQSNELSWSDEIYRIFELDRRHFGASYEAFLAAIHPEDLELVDQAYTESVRNHKAYDITHRLLMADGRVKYVNERCETYYDVSGTPLKSIGTVQDITLRRLAELGMQKSNRALHALSTCNGVLVRANDETQLLGDICDALVSIGGYRMAWVGFAERDADKSVRVVARAGSHVDYLDHIEISWDDSAKGHGPTGTAIRTGDYQVAQDILHDPRFLPWRDQAIARGYASSIALPLFDDFNRPFGAINLYGKEINAFDEDEIKLLQELAGDLAFGIRMLRLRAERDHLHERQQRSDETVKQALAGTIQAIAVTVEKRDPYTAGHQRRVANLSVAIAMELGLSDLRITGLRLGATIHDIGKIYVPAEILTRPGQLSSMEFEFIKSHPQVGYDIMKDVKLPWPVAEMILQHHEHIDGSGYPQGLKGDAILLEARILAVSDVAEAMMSHRPYRPALGLETALAEIDKYRGVFYDPLVVDVCLRLFREKGFSLSG